MVNRYLSIKDFGRGYKPSSAHLTGHFKSDLKLQSNFVVTST